MVNTKFNIIIYLPNRLNSTAAYRHMLGLISLVKKTINLKSMIILWVICKSNYMKA